MTVPNPDFDRVGAEEKQRDHRLEAEEAATAYWRSVAADRRVEAARVQKRPLVRAAIAIDRRTKAFQDRLGGAARTVLGHARNIAARADPGLGRPPSTVQETSLGPVGPNVEVFVIDGDSPEPGRTIVERGAVDDAISASTAEIVVLVAPGVRIGASDVAALVDAVDRPDVVAAVPTSLHPDDRRSAHAGAVRSAGGRLTLVGSTPVSEPIPSSGSTSTVDIAIGGAVAMRRDELVDAGGLGPLTDVTTAIVDLALRATRDGGSVVAVASARAVEPDHPRRRVELRERPVSDGPGWAAIIDRHGPRLRRTANAAGHPASGSADWSLVVTTATPSRKIAAHSGDWHFAGLFVDAVRRAGLEATRQTIAEVESPSGRSQDVHLVLRGLEPVRRSPGQVHVIWLISHPEALSVRECDEADLLLVASERYADYIATLTSTPVEVFEQATEPRLFRPDAASGARHGVTVVANTRGVRRTSVDAALAAGHRLTIHGLGWEGIVDDDMLVPGYAAFEDLPAIYASSSVVLNDHWETMRLWGFVSNRVLDATAAGASVISDHVPEIEERFGGSVPTWRTPEELASLLDDQAADPAGWSERAATARTIVLEGHTFDRRVQDLDALLRRHGLHPSPSTAAPVVPPRSGGGS